MKLMLVIAAAFLAWAIAITILFIVGLLLLSLIY